MALACEATLLDAVRLKRDANAERRDECDGGGRQGASGRNSAFIWTGSGEAGGSHIFGGVLLAQAAAAAMASGEAPGHKHLHAMHARFLAAGDARGPEVKYSVTKVDLHACRSSTARFSHVHARPPGWRPASLVHASLVLASSDSIARLIFQPMMIIARVHSCAAADPSQHTASTPSRDRVSCSPLTSPSPAPAAPTPALLIRSRTWRRCRLYRRKCHASTSTRCQRCWRAFSLSCRAGRKRADS